MENEENRGLIDKKAFEDQLVVFCQLYGGALPIFSLSPTLPLIILDREFSWSILGGVWHTWDFEK